MTTSTTSTTFSIPFPAGCVMHRLTRTDGSRYDMSRIILRRFRGTPSLSVTDGRALAIVLLDDDTPLPEYPIGLPVEVSKTLWRKGGPVLVNIAERTASFEVKTGFVSAPLAVYDDPRVLGIPELERVLPERGPYDPASTFALDASLLADVQAALGVEAVHITTPPTRTGIILLNTSRRDRFGAIMPVTID